MTRVVTVAIPVYNGARYLDEVLSAVRSQRVDAEVELLVIDSGSTDGSLEICERHGARIHSIPKSEFSHGGTRNLAMELARGDHVAFLTQDATPAHDGWLAAMLEGFEQADDVALVFGPHDARPDASHMIKSEMERHFATWGDGREITVQRLNRTGRELAAYRRNPGHWSFFSDVNGCVAKWAWRRVPYRAVPYAEDQLLGREMIEAGFAKVFHPDARVLHSHDYPPGRFLQRYFDEFRSLREVLHYVENVSPYRSLLSIRGLVGSDERWLRRHGVEGRALLRPLAVSARHHGLRKLGAVAGTRADRLPRPVRRALSLEGRDSFIPYHLPESPMLARPTQPDARPVELSGDWDWEFVARSYPSRPVAVEPHSGDATGPLTLAWVVPPWSIGSGGHTTIFRLIRQLELRGHRSAIFVFAPPYAARSRRGAALREEIRRHFVPRLEAEVFVGLDDFTSADVAIATGWNTAFAARDLPNCREKVYLVQDHEPEFYATSAQSIWAEETYRMGYRCIAYTPWMANLLTSRYGVRARWFECGTDLETFPFAGDADRSRGLIAVYARRETERRAVDLAMAGLARLAERRPAVRPVLFGSRHTPGLPFVAEDLGVVAPQRLARLYREADVGVVFSLTTHSLVAQEMMASGLPTVELAGDNVASALGASGELVEQAARRPDAIADAIERLLDDRAAAAAMAERARAFVQTRTWERAADQVEDALREFLSAPRERA